jgi:four helix bundle protein
MAVIKDFTELTCYQAAFSTAMRIFELSKSWPAEEKRSLTWQVRRASRSVGANIAEGWGKRRYPAHFVSKLSDADAECGETRAWLQVAHACKYISNTEHESLIAALRTVSGSLVKMMSNTDPWCGPSLLREAVAPYGDPN